MSLDMNPEIRAQWCAALRSGDYRQAKDDLRTETGYCCLGVLTMLYLRAGHDPEWEDEDEEYGFAHDVWDASGELAPPVQAWAGLYSSDPVLQIPNTAAKLNDAGCTFAEIADMIDGGAS